MKTNSLTTTNVAPCVCHGCNKSFIVPTETTTSPHSFLCDPCFENATKETEDALPVEFTAVDEPSERRAVSSTVVISGRSFMLDASVWLQYEDGTEEKAFNFYPDEISFCDNEFAGKTVEEALSIKVAKDVAYLRS